VNLDQLKQILDLMRTHELAEVEIEQEGLKLRVRKNSMPVASALPSLAPAPVASAPAPAAASTKAAEADEPEVELAVVKSPIVGTFYRSSEPGSAAFVEIGSQVKKGQVLCIIEAMKLMNEIDSEYDGEVTNVYVENGQPVQYGERLFAIRTR